MLTISHALSVSRAETYYQSEYTNPAMIQSEYYQEKGEAQGEWVGALAEEWLIAGPIAEAQFQRAINGQHPVSGEQLIKHIEARRYRNRYGKQIETSTHRAGWDATFSAPKSLVILAYMSGDEELKRGIWEDHIASVKDALAELEKFSCARVSKDKWAKSGKMVAAVFHHERARPDDKSGYAAPEIHTHSVIMNMTATEDGKVRAMQEREFFRSQNFLTAVYRIRMAERAQRRGVKLRIDKETGAPEVAGITRAYIEAASVRHEEINRKARDMQARLEAEGESVKWGAGLKQAAAKLNRKGKKYDKAEMERMDAELEEKFGRQAHLEAAAIRERGPIVYSQEEIKERAREAVDYGVERVMEREAVAPAQKSDEARPLIEIGSIVDIAGFKGSEVADARRIDGVDYELYRNQDGGGVIRVQDAETGETAGPIVTYSEFSTAQSRFETTIPIAESGQEEVRENQPVGVESAGKEEINDATATSIRSIRQSEVHSIEGVESESFGSGDHGDGAQGVGGSGRDVREDGGGRGRPLGGERADTARTEPTNDARTTSFVDEADPLRTETQPPSAARKPENYEITNPDTVVPSGKKSKVDLAQQSGREPSVEHQAQVEGGATASIGELKMDRISLGGIDALDRVGNISLDAHSIIESKRREYARNHSQSQQQAPTEAGRSGASPGRETSDITTGRGPAGDRISLQERLANGRERGGRAPDAGEVERDQHAGLTEALKPLRFDVGERLQSPGRGNTTEALETARDAYNNGRAPAQGMRALNEKVAKSQPVSGSEIALSERKTPSKNLPRVARRWDIPPIDERTVALPQIFGGVRSKIVKTTVGERVLWGNRQSTLVLEEALAQTGKRQRFDGAALSLDRLAKTIPIIRQVAHNLASTGADARGLFDLAANLASLAANAEGGVVGYVDADDTRTKAEVRMLEMHEVGVHVAQARIGRGTIKILSAAWMQGDPDYRQIARSDVGRVYVKDLERLAAEAAAYVLSGEYDKVGYIGADALKRARGFAGRYLGEVASLYGVDAVKKFRDIHPQMSVAVERIVAQNDTSKTRRAKLRSRGRTKGRDGGGLATSDRARSIGERERQALGEYLQAGWGGSSGERNRGTPAPDGKSEKSGELNFSLKVLKLGHGSSDLRPDFGSFREGNHLPAQSLAGYPNLQSQNVEERASRNADDHALALTSALKTIAAIDPSNQADTRSWRELAAAVVGTARAAVAGLEHVEDGKVNQALMEIAKMDPAGGPDAQRSCKEVTERGVGMARTALDAISQDTNGGTDVAMGAAETALDAPGNGRPPAQGISW